MIYFIADTHFGHANIVRLCQRPFENVQEMNEALIKAWNARVKQEDTIYILRDLFFCCDCVEDILMRLKGKKRLIIGNHDDSWMSKVDISKYFLSAEHYMEISDGKRAITLCHYPLLTWKKPKNSYMIYGHIHANTDADFWPLLKIRENVLNAGVDINGFCPVTFDELLENNRHFKAAH